MLLDFNYWPQTIVLSFYVKKKTCLPIRTLDSGGFGFKYYHLQFNYMFLPLTQPFQASQHFLRDQRAKRGGVLRLLVHCKPTIHHLKLFCIVVI